MKSQFGIVTKLPDGGACDSSSSTWNLNFPLFQPIMIKKNTSFLSWHRSVIQRDSGIELSVPFFLSCFVNICSDDGFLYKFILIYMHYYCPAYGDRDPSGFPTLSPVAYFFSHGHHRIYNAKHTHLYFQVPRWASSRQKFQYNSIQTTSPSDILMSFNSFDKLIFLERTCDSRARRFYIMWHC